MLAADVISAHPGMFSGFFSESMVARASASGACDVRAVDLRRFGRGRWRKVDDRPYGGGPGMLLCCKPWFDAVEACAAERAAQGFPAPRIVLTDPKGRPFRQSDARAFAAPAADGGKAHAIFLCGHYEGVDARVETLATDVFSVGDFVMTGGELAAAAMVDAIVRLLPGVLGGGAAAVSDESFSDGDTVEPPQYTRPPVFRGMAVPEPLLSGDHARIEAWRRSAAAERTAARRKALQCSLSA